MTTKNNHIFNPQLLGGPSPNGWSKIGTFLRCRKEYEFKYINNVQSNSNSSEALQIGTIFHICRAVWLSQDWESWEEISPVLGTYLEESHKQSPLSISAEQTALKLFSTYFHQQEMLVKPSPVYIEELITGQIDPRYAQPITSRLDDVSHYAEIGGKLAIGDAKTTSSSVQAVVDEYTLHGQPLLNALVWELDPRGAATHGPIVGWMLDIVVKRSPPQFARVLVEIPDLSWFREMINGAIINMDSGQLHSRNITACTRALTGMTFVCPYRELCLKGEKAAFRFTGTGAFWL